MSIYNTSVDYTVKGNFSYSTKQERGRTGSNTYKFTVEKRSEPTPTKYSPQELGPHVEGCADTNVEEVVFKSCRYIEQFGVLSKFSNLKHLSIISCGIKDEDIKVFHQKYSGLITLTLDNNKISSVSGFLASFANLSTLSMRNNRITTISDEFVSKVTYSRLNYIDFGRNLSFDILYDADHDSMEEFVSNLKNFKEMPNAMGLITANKELWDSGEMSDFIVKTKGKDFKVHKVFLGARSSVFRAMFNHTNMTENVTNEMTIEEFESGVVEEFLQFFYTAKLPTSDEHLMDLFAMASKYQIQELKVFCERKILLNINDENAVDVLSMANLYENEILKTESFGRITKMFSGLKIGKDLMKKPKKIAAIIEARKKLEKLVESSDDDE